MALFLKYWWERVTKIKELISRSNIIILTLKNEIVIKQDYLEIKMNFILFLLQIKKIPLCFDSLDQYFESFMNPLLEETRTSLQSSMDPISKAPFTQVISLEEINPSELGLYNIQIKKWQNGPKESSTPGDIFILSNVKPNVVSDLQRIGKTWTFASFFPNKDDDDNNNNETFMSSFTLNMATQFQNELKTTHLPDLFGQYTSLY